MDSRSEKMEKELMLRLRSQFGDLDLSNLVSDEKKTDDDAASEESSLADPSAEELRAWQEAQFQRGQAALEKKRLDEKTSAIQRRRDQLKLKKGNNAIDTHDEDDDWEQIAASPDLMGQSSVFFPTHTSDSELLGVHPLLQELASAGPEPDLLGTSWKRLYSSAEGDGLSFFNLLENIRGYPGPTVLLLGAIPSSSKLSTKSKGTVESITTTIGFFTASPWIESSSFTGTSDCFMFAFDSQHEKINFFKPNPGSNNDKERNYMYLHPSTLHVTSRKGRSASNGGERTKMTDGLVHGIGVGGTPLQPRLHLTESLEDCRAMNYCSLFEPGDLLLGHAKESLNFFDVDCLEVWAVGGDEWINESLATQKSHREVKEANLLRARTVKDKKQFLHDFTGGLLSGKPTGYFTHNQQETTRCDM